MVMKMTSVDLSEWDRREVPGIEFADAKARKTAEVLSAKGIIDIEEMKNGISITTNSYVGKITIGGLRINIYPKLKGMPLYKLLRYAYGLSDLKLYDSAEHSLSGFSFFDLLIYQMYAEADDIYRRGIGKSYLSVSEDLSTPRGRIDMVRLARSNVQTAALPCKYFFRSENTVLNQTVLAGLRLGIQLVSDNGLKMKLRSLAGAYSETIDEIRLNRVVLQKAKSTLNRLMLRYRAPLEIINILYESQGMQMEDDMRIIILNGFFFDMNAFFETLISRLLSDYCIQYTVKDQYSLSGMFKYAPGYNPKHNPSPTPRPDFAIFKNGRAARLLDAKYRDLWNNPLPRDMLYQLAVYAVSGVGDKTATILYPALDNIPSVQKVDIFNPVGGGKMAEVIIRPVNLDKISKALYSDGDSPNHKSDYLITIMDAAVRGS